MILWLVQKWSRAQEFCNRAHTIKFSPTIPKSVLTFSKSSLCFFSSFICLSHSHYMLCKDYTGCKGLKLYSSVYVVTSCLILCNSCTYSNIIFLSPNVYLSVLTVLLLHEASWIIDMTELQTNVYGHGLQPEFPYDNKSERKEWISMNVFTIMLLYTYIYPQVFWSAAPYCVGGDVAFCCCSF